MINFSNRKEKLDHIISTLTSVDKPKGNYPILRINWASFMLKGENCRIPESKRLVVVSTLQISILVKEILSEVEFSDDLHTLSYWEKQLYVKYIFFAVVREFAMRKVGMSLYAFNFSVREANKVYEIAKDSNLSYQGSQSHCFKVRNFLSSKSREDKGKYYCLKCSRELIVAKGAKDGSNRSIIESVRCSTSGCDVGTDILES